MAGTAALRWDIYCRVIDNYGDIGLCWRLARALAAGGDAVRLVADDLNALQWMAPGGAAGVVTEAWPGSGSLGDVVIEAFGCDVPAATVEAMAQRGARAPVWINLEHLSAEPFVELSHGLPSPQRNGLTKWFFFPGFTPRTGGLIREPELLAGLEAHDAERWLAQRGLARRAGERVVSLFCYDNPAIGGLLQALARQPTLLLLSPGPAQRQVREGLGLLRVAPLAWLAQPEYDRLLWSCDFNLVRGEDSLVRAVWAGRPFVWQAYPQPDGAHRAKVLSLLERIALPVDANGIWKAWNGLAPWPATRAGAEWPAGHRWQQAVGLWRGDLLAQVELCAQLRTFVRQHRSR